MSCSTWYDFAPTTSSNLVLNAVCCAQPRSTVGCHAQIRKIPHQTLCLMQYVMRSHDLLCDIMLKLVSFAPTTSSNLVLNVVCHAQPQPTV